MKTRLIFVALGALHADAEPENDIEIVGIHEAARAVNVGLPKRTLLFDETMSLLATSSSVHTTHAAARMLAADKLLLQSNVKQRSIELREKELKLFNQNFSAICTQSAIMAGFTLTTFVEIDLPPEKHLPKVWSAPSPHCLPMWTVAADRTRPALRRRCCTSS